MAFTSPAGTRTTGDQSQPPASSRRTETRGSALRRVRENAARRATSDDDVIPPHLTHSKVQSTLITDALQKVVLTSSPQPYAAE